MRKNLWRGNRLAKRWRCLLCRTRLSGPPNCPSPLRMSKCLATIHTLPKPSYLLGPGHFYCLHRCEPQMKILACMLRRLLRAKICVVWCIKDVCAYTINYFHCFSVYHFKINLIKKVSLKYISRKGKRASYIFYRTSMSYKIILTF